MRSALAALTTRVAGMAVLATSACALIDEPEPPGFQVSSSPTVDTQLILGAIGNGAYQTSPLFTHATKIPYPSSAVAGSMIDEWVSTDAYAQYSRIRPDQTGSQAVIPIGTIVLRAVLDVDGVVTALTVMCKGPAGYNPALGDWWFAKTDPNGVPIPPSDNATEDVGQLTGCYSCHQPRANDDFLFGIPIDDRP